MASDDPDALLAAFVASRGPDPQRQRHNWNATLVRLDEDPLADAPAPPRVHASRTWLLAAAGVIVVATALFGGRALFEADPSPPRSQAPASAAIAPSPAEAQVSTPPPTSVPAKLPPSTTHEIRPEIPIAPSEAPRRRPSRIPAREREAPKDTPASVVEVTPERLALETGLLARARAAATAHDDARAIALLQQHAREFPDGAMVEDRRAWLAIVQCRSKAAQGKRSAATFLAAHPRSPYAPRVRLECGEIE